MNLVYNERTKMLAAAFNNSAVATFATAIIAPMAAYLYGANAMSRDWWPLLSVAWLIAGLSLHLAGQYILGRLKE
jgi:Na+/melibiose symporter-like transporter